MLQKAEKTIEKSFKAAPDHLDKLKRESLAYLYQHSCQKYLGECSTDTSAVKLASKEWFRSTFLCPKISITSYSISLLKGLAKNWILYFQAVIFRKELH
jgi:hypothetical protein